LVVHHPVKLISGWLSEERELVSVAVEVARRPGSFVPPKVIGPFCCNRCNEPITEQRLKVIPGAKRCTKCQSPKSLT
jgi:formylmethanofuran dehydrogenase subunit E